MKVLIAVDDSKIAEKAFDWYVSHLHKEGSEVVVCHEADQPEFPTVGLFAGAHGSQNEHCMHALAGRRKGVLELTEINFNGRLRKLDGPFFKRTVSEKNSTFTSPTEIRPEALFAAITTGAVAFPQEEINRIVGEHRQRLQKLAEKYAEKCKAAQLSYKVFVDTVEGGAGNGILKRAEKVEANMIVIGTRGQGAVRRTILGSISDYVLHHAKIPVVVCHA